METTINLEALCEILSELRLKHFAQTLKADFETMSENERNILLQHLTRWVLLEKAERKSAQITSRIRSARFQKVQTIDTFNFKHSKMTEQIEKNYLKLHQELSKTALPSAIFSGHAGVGKTHLARALGYAACQKNLSVLYLPTAEMVNHLAHAEKAFTLESELNKYRRPQVLILDELGYVSMNTQASNLFFQVISVRHDQGLGTIATTNLPFGKFNQIFANDAIAHAIVDRLVNDADVFFMEGPSYREHQRKEKMKSKD